MVFCKLSLSVGESRNILAVTTVASGNDETDELQDSGAVFNGAINTEWANYLPDIGRVPLPDEDTMKERIHRLQGEWARDRPEDGHEIDTSR